MVAFAQRASSPEAYDLIHQGAIALANVEANGVRIDRGYLQQTKAEFDVRIAKMEKRFKDHDIWRTWRKIYGTDANLDSGDQLARILFQEMGFENERRTKTGRFKTDADALEAVDHPFATNYVKFQKLKKLRDTYMTGILRETCGDILHPFFNLHTTLTYRSSSDTPNFQNMPKRDGGMAKYIRQAFIPRDGHHFMEVDYSGIEVSIAQCYHHDPRMLKYLLDPSTDMHRDMAQEIFMLPDDQILPNPEDSKAHKSIKKALRQTAKSDFVFAEFYGDWYVACARSLWADIAKFDLTLPNGTPLYDHLAANGISERGECIDGSSHRPGTFEQHMKQVENRFWKERFPVYDQWRSDWYQSYLNTGGFETLTGFYITGLYGRNNVINYPVQGSAFHCLLRSLTRLNQWLNKNKMKTLIVGQIHDSILLDVHRDEVGAVTEALQRIMVDELRAAWKWICVPIEIEIEMAPLGRSWNECKELEIG